MSRQVEKWHPNPTFWIATAAMVLALLALVAAVSGVATASPRVIVRKGDLAPGAVTTKALAKGAVTGPKIRMATITAAKLGSGSVTAAKLGSGSVTAAKLGSGSVTGATLDNGSVTAAKLAAGSVTPSAIAPGAVTSGAIAPLSIGAAQLGEVELVVRPIGDLDKDAHNNEWTASNQEIALCGPGAKLLGGGFAFSTPTNGEADWTEELPIVNGEVNGVVGRFISDAGGAAGGQVAAICLKPK